MATPGFIPDPPKRCPKGHVVGTRKGDYRCTSAECGHDAHKAFMLAEKKTKGVALDLDEVNKLGPQAASHMQRMTTAGVPKNLTPDKAKAWTEEFLQKLLPEAAASVAWDLRYGTDKARSEAADKVLRANGMDKREAQQSAGASIILNIGTGESSLPWLKRVMPKAVEGVVQSTPEGDE
jgi:hypothetical protein